MIVEVVLFGGMFWAVAILSGWMAKLILTDVVEKVIDWRLRHHRLIGRRRRKDD